MLLALQVMVSAPTDANLALWRELGAQTTHDNADVVLGCDVIFLAVKPHIFPEVRFPNTDLKSTIQYMLDMSWETLIFDILSSSNLFTVGLHHQKNDQTTMNLFY